jgi:hypothetical protein
VLGLELGLDVLGFELGLDVLGLELGLDVLGLEFSCQRLQLLPAMKKRESRPGAFRICVCTCAYVFVCVCARAYVCNRQFIQHVQVARAFTVPQNRSEEEITVFGSNWE